EFWDRQEGIARSLRSHSGLAPLELIAEIAARSALHQRLRPAEADVAAAGRGDVDVGLADQQRAELGFAQSAKELGKTAAGNVEFLRFLVAAVHVDGDLPQ